MLIIGFLLPIAFMSFLGALLLRLAIWPALNMAGARKEKHVRYFSGCYLLSLVWLTGAGAVPLQCVIYAENLSMSAIPPPASPTFAKGWLLVACLSCVIAGAVCGTVVSRVAPLPRVAIFTTAAGSFVGALIIGPLWFRGRYGAEWFLLQLAWLGLPLAAVYGSAFLQHTRLSRFRKGSCVLCKFERVGRRERCTECGKLTRHLCHRCRHIVDARPGERCPKCKKATIAASCWKCGYDWRGLDAPRCPECGVWKPVLPAEPAPNPPSPPASLY